MKIIKVSELKPGVSYSKPLYFDGDIVFVNANTVITESDIERLKKFSITEVTTEGNLNSTVNKQEDKAAGILAMERSGDEANTLLYDLFENLTKSKVAFNNLYKECFDSIQQNYRLVSEDKQVEISKFREISEKLVDYIKTHPNIAYNVLNTQPVGYYLYNQVIQASIYSIYIGILLEYSKPKLIELGMASLFADVGMTKLPPSISEKQHALTEEEYKNVMKHTLIGYQLLTRNLKVKNTLALVSLQHHEKTDGTGYPQKLNAISLEEFSKIYSIADNFAALTNNRPYRKKMLPYEAIRNMISTDMNKFDLKIVRAFMDKLSMYPVGSFVELSDNRTAVVIGANPTKPLRPILKILQDPTGAFYKNVSFLNLLLETNIYITKAIHPPA